MGKINAFEPEKLVIGIMYTERETYASALERLEADYGETDLVSEEYAFSAYSPYYDREMDGKVWKRFVSFARLTDPALLPEIKLHTNALEEGYAVGGDRRVNLDPCLLSHGRFVMATTKGASFRVPLARGIYGDLSLVYARGAWADFFWTYADVRSERIKGFLLEARELYLRQRRAFRDGERGGEDEKTPGT